MLTPVEALALSKIKADREAVAAGDYDLDFVVRVVGSMRVGEDTDKIPTVSIPVKEVLALFIARSGCTREHSLALLRDCMRDALSHGTRGQGAIDAAADIDTAFKEAVDDLTGSLPRTPVKGQVRCKISLTPIRP